SGCPVWSGSQRGSCRGLPPSHTTTGSEPPPQAVSRSDMAKASRHIRFILSLPLAVLPRAGADSQSRAPRGLVPGGACNTKEEELIPVEPLGPGIGSGLISSRTLRAHLLGVVTKGSAFGDAFGKLRPEVKTGGEADWKIREAVETAANQLPKGGGEAKLI